MNETKKTFAAILVCGRVQGYTFTTLKNGRACCYGKRLNNCILEQGKGRISRSKKNLDIANSLMGTEETVDCDFYYQVNEGGGCEL